MPRTHLCFWYNLVSELDMSYQNDTKAWIESVPSVTSPYNVVHAHLGITRDKTPEKSQNGTKPITHDDHKSNRSHSESEVGDSDVDPGDMVVSILLGVLLGKPARARQAARNGASLLRQGGEVQVEQLGDAVKEAVGAEDAADARARARAATSAHAIDVVAAEILEGRGWSGGSTARDGRDEPLLLGLVLRALVNPSC